jgi:hypothetical protein
MACGFLRPTGKMACGFLRPTGKIARFLLAAYVLNFNLLTANVVLQ